MLQFRGGEEVNPGFIIQHRAIGSDMNFRSPCIEGFKQKCFHNLIKKFFVLSPPAVQNSLVIRDDFLEVSGIVRVVRIESVRIVDLVSVDVHVNIGKKLVNNVVYMCNEKNWSPFLLLRFLIWFCLFFVLLFKFFVLVSFRTGTSDKF